MGGAFASRGRVKITNDADEWIEIKAKLSANDQRILQDEALSFDIYTKDARALMGSAAYIMMKLAFTGWRLLEPVLDKRGEPVLDAEGKPKMQLVPFSEEAVQDIDPDYPIVSEAITKITELNPTLWKASKTGDAKTSKKPIAS